ncbi:hypothetical protein LH51_01210 [Nitrincola sp. A-D6]|uniref:hypothetical protein n=1 Tax=Nitrincola sp. A-D6 TaxID=1545442 RepID=UPI00051F91D8|nr:hypothetical protein [Nitrincola sp. A-D6]KGK43279.1 hypothetical protein LH51_01210 [Nitrincola sp. A-D6]
MGASTDFGSSGDSNTGFDGLEGLSEPQADRVQADTGSERIVFSEEGAVVTETRNPDGNTSLRASVDVIVTDSGEVIFSDIQQEAFGVVSLAVTSIMRTSGTELVIDIQDTSPNASSQQYSGSLGNGSSLPGWITLDPATGSVTINNPPTGQREVIIRIQAMGTDGQIRVLELKLDLEKLLRQQLQEQPEAEADVSFIPLSEQLETELAAQNQYGERLMSLLQSA